VVPWGVLTGFLFDGKLIDVSFNKLIGNELKNATTIKQERFISNKNLIINNTGKNCIPANHI
jgi:hypothetical protein